MKAVLSEIKRKKIKEAVLGKKYNLSLVFATGATMKKLNAKYRDKNKTANVLSFPLDAETGEIFVNKRYEGTDWGDYLFLHSLFHLRGLDHGEKMDKEEETLAKKFKLPFPQL